MPLNKNISASSILYKVKYDLAYVLIAPITVLLITEKFKKLLSEIPTPLQAEKFYAL